MKFLRYLILLLALPAFAADRITISLTVTNGTTNGMTFVLNGSTRTFTNNVQASSIQVLTNTTGAGTKTNLYNQVALNPFSQVSILNMGASNISFVGASGLAMSATVGGTPTWGFVTYTTQTVATLTAVRIPVSGEPTAAIRTNISSELVTALETYSTNSLNQNSTTASELVGLTNSQTITGAKVFNNRASSATVGTVNSTNFVGTISLVTNGNWWSGASVNTAITNATLAGTFNFAQGESYMVGDGDGVTFYSAGSGGDKMFGLTNGIFFFDPAITRLLNVTESKNKVLKATSTGYLELEYLTTLTDATIEAATFARTNHFPAQSDISFARHAITTLANGANSVSLGTNVFIQVSGPSAAFTINGMDGQPVRDGKLVFILNLTGQNMTIAHDSGTEPTAANRIYTMTGADHATTGNGAATLIYSASSARWILLNLQE